MITKKQLSDFREAANKALAEVAKEHGFEAKVGNCTFGNNEAKYQLHVTSLSEDGTAVDLQAIALQETFPMYVGLEFDGAQGRRFKTVGYNRKARKNAFVIEEMSTGKRFVCPLETIMNAETVAKAKAQLANA